MAKINPMDSIHGSARLVTAMPDDLSFAFNPVGCTGVVLGFNHPLSIKGSWWIPPLRRGHALTFGATGAGKGAGSIVPALLTYCGSCVVLDPKGENAWVTAERRRQLGQRVVLLDPWGEVQRRYADMAGATEQATKFNPLAHLRADSPEFSDDVGAIAEAVIVTQGNDPHWSDSARELISGLIAAAVERAPGVASFRDVRDLLRMPEDQLQDVIDTIKLSNPDSLSARKLRRFTRENKEIASIRSTAETQTAILDAVTLLESMETDENAFDLADLARQRVTLYLVLPIDKLDTHGRWMRLILTLAIRAIAKEPSPPDPPVLFVLDEMGTITPGVGGGLKMIERSVGLMGGMGIRIWAFLQDLTQLQRDYPHTWESFIANSEVVQLLRVNDMTTARYFSDRLGQRTVKEIHRSTSWSTGQPGQPISRNHSEAVQYHAQAILKPEQLMDDMPPETAVIIRAGDKPNAKLWHIPYFRDPRWQGFYRPHPHYRQAAPVVQPNPADMGGVGDLLKGLWRRAARR